MPRGHAGLPTAAKVRFSKRALLDSLVALDNDAAAKARCLSLEQQFRQRIAQHVESLPAEQAKFQKFNTNPYVLMIHAKKHGYGKISEIEADILPAKLFSSMETSAGRMIEAVTLPSHGWAQVPSGMHTVNSVLDGKRLVGDTLRVATLKSGPRCLNDEMSKDIGTDVMRNVVAWARDAGVTKVEFTYGVLYGTPSISNKKDWHVLRNMQEAPGGAVFSVLPTNRWDCKFTLDGIEVTATIRIGAAWWEYLGGSLSLVELVVALIRACVPPAGIDPADHQYSISDLGNIVSVPDYADQIGIALLQREQLPWFFFLMRHFCDELIP